MPKNKSKYLNEFILDQKLGVDLFQKTNHNKKYQEGFQYYQVKILTAFLPKCTQHILILICQMANFKINLCLTGASLC